MQTMATQRTEKGGRVNMAKKKLTAVVEKPVKYCKDCTHFHVYFESMEVRRTTCLNRDGLRTAHDSSFCSRYSERKPDQL